MKAKIESKSPTVEQIIEGNKLIALFMGAEFIPNWRFLNKPENQPLPTFVFKMNNLPSDSAVANHGEEHLNYHRSWSWLMPVFFKIQKTYQPSISMEITPFHTTIYISEKIKIFCGSKALDEGTEGDLKYKYIPTEEGIITTWTAVVEFLKWINENKK